MPTSAITRRDMPPQPILFIRRSIEWSEISDAIASCLGAVSEHCQHAELAVAGPPFARYSEMGADRLTIEIGMPLSVPAAGNGEVEAGFLQSGSAAVAIHEGDYESLQETHGTIERWVAENGHLPAGPPWESYITDPGDLPNSADWRTEVYWPIAD